MRGHSVSQAASFDDPTLSEENCRILNERLKNFKAVGLRENHMVPYVTEHEDVPPVQKVVDPTLLHTSEKYDEIAVPERLEKDMYISVVNLLVNIAGNFVFIYFWGITGLALATSVSAIATFIVRLGFVKKYVDIESKKIMMGSIKILLVSCVACFIPRLICRQIVLNVYVELIIAAFTGCILYLVLAKIFRIAELNELMDLVTKKIKKR